ncbi:MAG: hypothetical protein IJ600_02185 [Lachnospiraceae bacterium]|nr:hypothetical protein [Lachnospiraceae bacterium]
MTKKEVFDEINKTQDEYVDQLIQLINCSDYDSMKTISFTSPTGTGKTKMMANLINHFHDYYFIVTTLSKGQLHKQVRNSLEMDCNQKNYYVYGSADYRINSILDSKDIIRRIPAYTRCIWIRDEGHIKTNRFEELLMKYCYKVINFSATNIHSDIQCNFAHTMMLRTVNQMTGTPADAIKKLCEIKKKHKKVKKYNPCAIIRCIGGKNDIYRDVVDLCKKYKLKYIDITDDPFVMAELCKDDNEYDVIINKYKIVEGIDIRRAHVLYMDNQPNNNMTTIQVIGRCRRNALIYRNDIDIFERENKDLLQATRECFVYYNVNDMKIDTDENGELYYAFCDHISCESLKANTRVYVNNGQLTNGLYVIELKGKTGWYNIKLDKQLGFNIVDPETDFYALERKKFNSINDGSRYKEYTKVVNDRESAIIGVDYMMQLNMAYTKGSGEHKAGWVESRSVTSKIGMYNKLNSFISKRYKKELKQAKEQYFTGKNELGLDTKCNSMIGYCVEYYSKYLLYGREYLEVQFEKDGSYNKRLRNFQIVHACMLKYKEMMGISFGSSVVNKIRIMSLDELKKDKHSQFVNTVVELGKRTANYVRKVLYTNSIPRNNIDPNLSIQHITGLADYITEDTILDVKVLNSINERSIRQVLAYHYLSTKRSDIHIKRVIVYDATSDKSVVVNIENEKKQNENLSITWIEYLFTDLFKNADINFIPIESERLLEGAMAQLDMKSQRILNMYYQDELSEQEISENERFPESVIDDILIQSRLYLKLLMLEEYMNRAQGQLW